MGPEPLPLPLSMSLSCTRPSELTLLQAHCSTALLFASDYLKLSPTLGHLHQLLPLYERPFLQILWFLLIQISHQRVSSRRSLWPQIAPNSTLQHYLSFNTVLFLIQNNHYWKLSYLFLTIYDFFEVFMIL